MKSFFSKAVTVIAVVLSIWLLVVIPTWVIGNSNRGRDKREVISYWNNSDKTYRLIVTPEMLCGAPIQTYLYSVYPMYQNGNIEQHNGYYYVELFDVTRLDYRKFNMLFTGDSPNTTYTVVGHFILTKNLDH